MLEFYTGLKTLSELMGIIGSTLTPSISSRFLTDKIFLKKKRTRPPESSIYYYV